ncbi:hypothetical protein DSO57_1037620 [Entomophthora muscae]|uniref:Uncharacterized protein n=1 Tax=Entomophthora muscae TaxID=34485 RepID=A0ACC2RPZ5_9FUNG|nr:hypothetical protein DSO57_1037620 [Entomophthora muscae]
MNGTEFMGMLRVTKNVINGISLVGGLSVAVMIFSAMVVDKKSMDRVSIRITLVISILDIFAAGFNIYGLGEDVEGIAYPMYETVVRWIALAYLFLNMSIAVNLQLVYVHEYAFDPRWERLYWFMSFGMATAFSMVIPVVFILDIEGVDMVVGGDETSIFICEWGLHLIWILLTSVYCSFVIAIVIHKLLKHEQRLKQPTRHQAVVDSPSIRPLIFRVAMYCAIPVITQTGYLVLTIVEFYYGAGTREQIAFMFVSTALPGTLNFIAFLIDPAFKKALYSLKAYHVCASSPFGWWQPSKCVDKEDANVVALPSSQHQPQVHLTNFASSIESFPKNDSRSNFRTSVAPSDSTCLQYTDETPSLLPMHQQRVTNYMRYL